MAEIHTEPGDDLSLLLKDFDYLQRAIDKLDAQRFQIKNWAVTTAGGVLAIAFGTQLSTIALIGLVTTLFFGFLEVIYTAMQADVIARSNKLENLINSSRDSQVARLPDYTFGISQAFAGVISFRRTPRLIFSKGRIHLGMFYSGLFFAVIAGAAGVALV